MEALHCFLSGRGGSLASLLRAFKRVLSPLELRNDTSVWGWPKMELVVIFGRLSAFKWHLCASHGGWKFSLGFLSVNVRA